jgi:hypothetical protein
MNPVVMLPSAQRRAKTLSSMTGTIRPEYPICLTGTAFTAVVMMSAAVMVPLEANFAPVYVSIAAPMDTSPSGAGVGSTPMNVHPGVETNECPLSVRDRPYRGRIARLATTCPQEPR